MSGNREPAMLTGMTEEDWSIALEVFDAAQSNRTFGSVAIGPPTHPRQTTRRLS
jgi:hypothetical protein